ncbi:MAG: PhoH family protein, partial [Fibrobacter sp.]|nr:PhoH family protein [Fibrobacter sp.]
FDLGAAPIIRNRFGISIGPKTPSQAELVKAVEKNDVIFAKGPAGTGKTFLAVALAVASLERNEAERICLVRPAVEAGESLGFLPGDLKEKIAPYLRPIHDSLSELLPPEKLRRYEETGAIEVAPLAYMRGRTLKRAFIILDEAQNTTIPQMKMFLTRLGPHSKAIITGDTSQVDLAQGQKSGLEHAMTILNGIRGIAQVEFTATDVLRHPLVKDILSAYEQKDSK